MFNNNCAWSFLERVYLKWKEFAHRRAFFSFSSRATVTRDITTLLTKLPPSKCILSPSCLPAIVWCKMKTITYDCINDLFIVFALPEIKWKQGQSLRQLWKLDSSGKNKSTDETTKSETLDISRQSGNKILLIMIQYRQLELDASESYLKMIWNKISAALQVE